MPSGLMSTSSENNQFLANDESDILEDEGVDETDDIDEDEDDDDDDDDLSEYARTPGLKGRQFFDDDDGGGHRRSRSSGKAAKKLDKIKPPRGKGRAPWKNYEGGSGSIDED